MNLLLFNLVTDVDHPILGFTTHWIHALAARASAVDVITMRTGRIEIPDNVRVQSVGAERGWSEVRRVVEFYRLLTRILRRGRIDGCFSHMTPEFSILAGPILRVLRIPLITWYAHPSLHWRVKLAHRVSHQMVSSVRRSYPWREDKLSVIGQGIDTTLFSPNGILPEENMVLCVGRISPVKNHATLLRAAAALKRPARVVIVGKSTGAEDERYAASLRRLACELGIQDRVAFEDGVPPAQLPGWYRRCAVHVNLTGLGFGDKVAWEAMACGRPCLVANEDLHETLGIYTDELLFGLNDPADLAVKLEHVLAKSDTERAEMGSYLRGQVERLHSLPRLAGRVIEQIGRFAAVA